MARNALLLSLLVLAASAAACGKKDNGPGTDTGNACSAAADCYPNVTNGALSGPAQCLDRVSGGYCTHTCQTDSDCCAAKGECSSDSPEQVCAPFESTGQMDCFLSCEGQPDTYCQDQINSDFSCRSTGGGNANRKVCVPNG